MDESPVKYALIVAAGMGSRMQADIPKQFLLLQEIPVLMHTINAFAGIEGIRIIVVLPASHIAHWKELCKQHSFTAAHEIAEGGDTRFHSVRNGLAKVSDGLVAIHDGARPLIDEATILRSFIEAEAKGNAITAVKMKDSIREVVLTGGNRNANRNNYFLIQTPQTFRVNLIKAAYDQATHYNFTDDAAVLEEAGGAVNIIEGEYGNIKITTPEDLTIAEALMKFSPRPRA